MSWSTRPAAGPSHIAAAEQPAIESQPVVHMRASARRGSVRIGCRDEVREGRVQVSDVTEFGNKNHNKSRSKPVPRTFRTNGRGTATKGQGSRERAQGGRRAKEKKGENNRLCQHLSNRTRRRRPPQSSLCYVLRCFERAPSASPLSEPRLAAGLFLAHNKLPLQESQIGGETGRAKVEKNHPPSSSSATHDRNGTAPIRRGQRLTHDRWSKEPRVNETARRSSCEDTPIS